MNVRHGRWFILLVLALAACGSPAAPSVPPAAVQATAAPSATAAPTVTPQPQPPATEEAVVYLWPATVPEGKQIDRVSSAASPTSLHLELIDAANEQDYISISGAPRETISAAPGSRCAATIMVRGQQGNQCSTGAGVTVRWEERGWLYTVGGGMMTADRAVAIADSLEAVDLATWQQHLEAQSASPGGAGADCAMVMDIDPAFAIAQRLREEVQTALAAADATVGGNTSAGGTHSWSTVSLGASGASKLAWSRKQHNESHQRVLQQWSST